MSEIFYTDSASFQTFEVTNKATFNNITVSGSLSFSGSYSLPFAICEIPFLNQTDQNTYSAGVENYIELDPTFNINSGEFSATNRFISGSLEISKTGYYSIYASITLNFASNPDDVVTVKIYDHAANKPISTRTYVISNVLSQINSIDIGGAIDLIDISGDYIYVTIQTTSTNFGILSTVEGESLLTITQVR